jgi:dTDP-4-dehydrorhamnose 3,5-epimerase
MIKLPTLINDAFIIKPKVFKDDRGFFLESWNKQVYNELGIGLEFVQDNHSKSSKNTLRGLHYQVEEFAQGKLVWVTSGVVYDVFVDLRKHSSTYGMWDSYHLDSESHCRLWIPPGCAHGFLAMTDVVDFHYKCTNYYNPQADRTLIWNDQTLKIAWPISKKETPIISDKDKKGKTFDKCEKYY